MEKKLELRLTEAARDELWEIARIHLELVGPKSARNITNKIRNALERLCTHPRMGQRVEDRELNRRGYRKLICGNYLCFYRQIETIIYVYHIADGRTDYPRLFSSLPQMSREEAEQQLLQELGKREQSAMDEDWIADDEVAQDFDMDTR